MKKIYMGASALVSLVVLATSSSLAMAKGTEDKPAVVIIDQSGSSNNVDANITNNSSNPVPVVGNVNTSVSNFPTTQDVSVTNTSSNPVPVTLAKDRGQITGNSLLFDVPAGTTEVFGPDGFQALNVFYVNATGLDEKVKMILGEESAIKLVLYGNMDSGIGQEDYVISLTEPIYISQIEVECLEASGSCKLFVEVVGKY